MIPDLTPRRSQKPHVRPTAETASGYDKDYFDGVSSGYPAQGGYREGHPDWDAWLDVIQLLQPGGTLVDLGCAYGYLLERARRRGYVAVGLDISAHACRQEPAISGRCRADLHHLPLKEGCADVVALFDVLEHLDAPETALQEAVRLLKPNGLLIGATPDPIFFEVDEETHIFERPPSFWLDRLERCGLRVRFRFSNHPYNFQFAAAWPETSTASHLEVFQHDYVDARPEFLTCGTDRIEAVPRSGWGPLQETGRALRHSGSIYLLNRAQSPARLSVGFRLERPPGNQSLRVRLNSWPLKEVFLSPEQSTYTVELPPFLVPSGGSHLVFELSPQGPQALISRITLQAEAATRDAITSGLPFDLYQRYRHTADICEVLQPSTLLDIGGYLGDASGHLATSGDFLGPPSAGWLRSLSTTDIRQCDHPGHRPAPASAQPFEDGSFEAVVSLDVLEHLPQEARGDFLRELDRLSSRWIVLGAPFLDAAVTRAEDSLRESLLSSRRFLQEHAEYGLPDLDATREFFEARSYQVKVFPNGWLESWVAMQALTALFFSHNDWTACERFNRHYNSHGYPGDLRRPAYRHLLVVSKEQFEPHQTTGLEQLTDSCETAGLHPLSSPGFLSACQRLVDLGQRRRDETHDGQFLFNERVELIHRLEASLQDQATRLDETAARLQAAYRRPLLQILKQRLLSRFSGRKRN